MITFSMQMPQNRLTTVFRIGSLQLELHIV